MVCEALSPGLLWASLSRWDSAAPGGASCAVDDNGAVDAGDGVESQTVGSTMVGLEVQS